MVCRYRSDSAGCFVQARCGPTWLGGLLLFLLHLEAGDKLLLCSDGLWEMVHDPDIQQIMSVPVAEPSQAVEALVQAALEGAGRDNVNVIVAFVS